MSSRPVSEIDSVFESSNILRHLTIESIDKNIFTFDKISYEDYRINKLQRLLNIKKKRIEIINKVSKSGAILTGSKVLSKSYLDGKKILDRSTKYSDWDFLVTEKMAYKISSELNFKENEDKLSLRIIDDAYDYEKQYIDLILVESMPNHYKVGDFLYTDPIFILNKKIEMLKNNVLKGSKKRCYEDDLKSFFWKFNHLIS